MPLPAGTAELSIRDLWPDEHPAARLADFVAEAWHVVEPKTRFVPNWHIDAICDHLQAVTEGEIRYLLITIQPRAMKSLAVSVFWPAWAWAEAPHLRWLYSSYAQTLSTRDSVKCRRLLESPWYRARYGHRFRLTSDQNVKNRFENDKTGLRLATSVGGSATGEGGDVIVADDPHKIEEGDSLTMRLSTIDWWDQTMSTRMNDPDRSAQVIVMQRIHETDLAGHVLEQGGFTHLCLPAEYEPSHPFVWPDDPRTEPGELLWPERFGRAALERLKRSLGSRAAAGQLQQLPAPKEGSILKRHWWRYYAPGQPPHVWYLIQSWDTAFKDKTTNDYVAGQLWGLRGANRYLLRIVRGHWDLPETKRQIRAMTAFAWELESPGAVPMVILVENRANGPEVIAELRAEIAGLVPVNPHGDKVQRVHAVTPQLEAGNVFLPGFALPGKVEGASDYDLDEARSPASTAELVHQAALFPAGAHDDDVDALTQALSRARMVDASAPPGEDFPVGALGDVSGKTDPSIGFGMQF